MRSTLQMLSAVWLICLIALPTKLSAQEKPAIYEWGRTINEIPASVLATIDDKPKTQDDYSWSYNVTAYNGTYSSDYYFYYSWSFSGGCDCDNEYTITFKRNGGDHRTRKAKSGNISVATGPSRSYKFTTKTSVKGGVKVVACIPGCSGSGNSSGSLNRSTASIRRPKSISAGNTGIDFVTISWEKGTDIPNNDHEYRIYRDNFNEVYATVSGSTRSFTDTDVGPSETHTYYVRTYTKNWGAHESSSRSVTMSTQTGGLTASDGEFLSRTRLEWPDLSKYASKIQVWRQDETGEELLETLDDSKVTSYSDDSGLPGFRYTYFLKLLKGNEYKTYTALFDEGFRKPNGVVSGYVKAPFGGPVGGVEVCIELLGDIPQSENQPKTCAVTDEATGFYEIRDIYYNETAKFRLIPSKDDHGFSPAFQERTLSLTSPSYNNVNFTDTTSFTVSGRITQVSGQDTCGLPGVEILLNGEFKGTETDSKGNYILTAEEIGEYTISARYNGHSFEPVDSTLFIEEDIFNLNFENIEKNIVSGYVKATCDIYIGQADIRIWSSDSEGTCIDTTVRTQEGSGYFELLLPSRSYQIALTNFYPEDETIVKAEEVEAYFLVDTVDLTFESASRNFIYRRAPEVILSGFPEKGCAPYDVPIAEQGKAYEIVIEVLEVFGSDSCYADTGYVVITDNVSFDNAKPDTVPIQSGFAFYEMVPGDPNIVESPNNPYQKLFEVNAHVELDANVDEAVTQANQQVLVTGNKARDKTFLSVSPELPFMILRDPPGDASYSYLEKSNSSQAAMRLFAQKESSTTLWGELKTGVKVSTGLSFPGGSISTTQESWGKIGGSLEVGARVSAQGEYILTINNQERFSTSNNSKIIGEEGDVFAGAAFNLIYALTDVVEYNPQTCKVELSNSVIVGTDSFATTFLYTETHIRDVLIPQLEQLERIYTVDTPDADSAEIYRNQISVWQQTLQMNQDLKEKAEFKENRSFSANAPYESSRTITHEGSASLEFGFFMQADVAKEAGYEVAGSGFKAGVLTKMRMEWGASATVGFLESRKTGYVLFDNDPGDFFSVDVLDDQTYGTPVFNLVSGRSSCPFEFGTQAREGVQLLMDSYSKFDVNPNEAAVFKLSLGNISQSDEAKTYELTFLQESNPDGAVITLGGSPVQGGIATPITIPAGKAIEQTITVSRGPLAYDYNDLQFILRSGCGDTQIADTVSFSVNFLNSCSDIAVFLPESDWLLSSKDNNQIRINIRDYKKNELEEVRLEFAPYLSNDWQIIEAFSSQALEDGPFGTDYFWQVDNLTDGEYKIRARVKCAGGISYSGKVSGIIDRNAPEVFGLPEPADGLLEEDEVISIQFNEAINCQQFDKDAISLIEVGSGNPVQIEVGCSGDKLIIMPLEGQDLAGKKLEVMIPLGAIADVYGNETSDNISWNFDVAQEVTFVVKPLKDTDRDLVANGEDNCPFAANVNQSDIDNDGIGDLCDDDIDGDGVANENDNCPFTPNPNQEDADNDGIGDVCEEDADGDGDGVINSEDNCPFSYNPGQEDQDQDGIGDVCDQDLDGDGVVNAVDNCPIVANPAQEEVECNPVTSLDELDSMAQFIQLLPNPVVGSSEIRLNLPESKFALLEVYDLQGRKIKELLKGRQQAGDYSLSLNADEYANGIYLIRFQYGDQLGSLRMMVNK